MPRATWLFLPMLLAFLAAGVRADISDRNPLPLTPRKAADTSSTSGRNSTSRSAARGSTSVVTTLGSLAAVIALILLAARIFRKSSPATQSTLPAGVLQVLGRRPLDYRHSVHLVRCGSRLLVLGASNEGLRTLAEITDPVEVDFLAGQCQSASNTSVADSFGQLFRRFRSSEPPESPEAIGIEAIELPSEEPAEVASPTNSPLDPAVLRLKQRLNWSTPDNDDENGPYRSGEGAA